MLDDTASEVAILFEQEMRAHAVRAEAERARQGRSWRVSPASQQAHSRPVEYRQCRGRVCGDDPVLLADQRPHRLDLDQPGRRAQPHLPDQVLAERRLTMTSRILYIKDGLGVRLGLGFRA